MAYNFLAWEHDQAFLLPPDIREWLPADHEVWALLETAELLDFSAFVARRRPDGWGRAAYHPAMMALLLLYAYAVGERSSRQIERRCRQDVAFRVLCANQTPDHATIARFRADHEAELLGLHVQVVSLCAAAGMVSVGLVALDSTKMAADASTKASRRHATITAELQAMYAEAAATDAAEDAQAATSERQAPGRLPRQLAAAADRRERFQQAARQIEERVAAEQAAFDAVQARQQAREAAGRPRRGRPRQNPPLRPELEGRRANTTDPDSRMLRKPGGFVQAGRASWRSRRTGSRWPSTWTPARTTPTSCTRCWMPPRPPSPPPGSRPPSGCWWPTRATTATTTSPPPRPTTPSCWWPRWPPPSSPRTSSIPAS